MKKLFIVLSLGLLPCALISQSVETVEAKANRMEWFSDAKLGIFVHYGIYAVDGIDESWSFYNGKVTHEQYMKQLKGFTAKKLDTDRWADLFAESGARYAVLTSKHHDGVALYHTAMNDLSVVRKSPAKKDVVEMFCNSVRSRGMKAGLYFSLIDWTHPDYPNFTREEKRYTNDPLRWDRFLTFMNGQLDEIATRFNPDLWWFDGDWEFSAEEWKAPQVREKLLGFNPGVIINSRLQGYGDYETPENGVPIHQPESPWWELCMTLNDSWGYQPTDRNYKTANQVIRIFADCIGLGGNLLLNIGPKEDGTIPEEQVAILKELGRWTGKHSDAIYGTRAGVSRDWYSGPSTRSKDGTKLYLFVEHKPNGPLVVKGLKNKVATAWVVGSGVTINTYVMMKPWWSNNPGQLYINVPEDQLDPQVTVVCLSLATPLE
ncbi:MAG: alpha-L-fucosidase [Bacteroidales bacterium]